MLIPKENEKDLADVPENVKGALTIIPVSTVDEVLANALAGPLTPIEWNEDDAPPRAALAVEDVDADDRRHPLNQPDQ